MMEMVAENCLCIDNWYLTQASDIKNMKNKLKAGIRHRALCIRGSECIHVKRNSMTESQQQV